MATWIFTAFAGDLSGRNMQEQATFLSDRLTNFGAPSEQPAFLRYEIGIGFLEFRGTNLTYDPGSPLIACLGGTLTEWIGGTAGPGAMNDMQVTGLNRAAKPVFDLLDQDKGRAAYMLLLSGNDTITGTVNGDTLIGGAGADRVLGGGGNDALFGGGGNDVLKGGAGLNELFGGGGADRLYAGAGGSLDGGGGADRLFGGAQSQTLHGRAGDDTINGSAGGLQYLFGGTGRDNLTGGLGADYFVFGNEPAQASNADVVTDFSLAADKIALINFLHLTVLTGPGGTLAASQFTRGSAARDAGDRIIHARDTGQIFYDPDGTGAQAQRLFATVDPGLALTHDSFLVLVL